ncbi:hypothetical protein [Halomonas sp. CKK8]|uniref:hypothetical protein n=1 Tax=Halomonas sp. CKK8 TaxID=3036127 RepID=UPI0024150BD1|nr:hypothetical protein [Halomonas sp. CKK8]WFM71816.1 hypothetical protein P8934_02165 [Halomonas sp. CKK8]
MEEIYKNLSNPEWWFNGLFFIIVGAVIPFLSLKVVPFLGKVFVIKPVRKLRARRLKKIKKLRWDDVKVSYEASKSAALLAVFLTSFAIYFVSLSMTIAILMSSPEGSNIVENDTFFSMSKFSMLFVFFMEIAFLEKRIFVSSLFFRRERINNNRMRGFL